MYNYDDEYNWERRAPRSRRNTMATAALVLGILSVSMYSYFFISLPCGALAVICAILSRDNRPMVGQSKAGIFFAVIGAVITITFTVFTVHKTLTTESSREILREYLQYYYEMYIGDYDAGAEEEFEELFPFLYDSDESTQEGLPGDDSGNSDIEDGAGNGSADDGSGTQPDGSDRNNGNSNSGGSGGSDSVGEGGFI